MCFLLINFVFSELLWGLSGREARKRRQIRAGRSLLEEMACSNVGKAAEGEFKSRAKNPFDSSSSDEEETHAAQMKKTSIFPVTQNSNPFDDAEEEEIPHPRGVRNPNPNSYSNPFDDLEEDVPTTTKLPTDESANSNLESITNPFEDEHEHGPSPSSLESKSLFHVEEDNSKYTSAKSPRSSSSRMIKDRAWSISQKAKASILSANLKFRQREASLQLTDTPANDEVRFPPPSRFENKFVSRTQELLSYDSSPGSHTGKQSKDLLLDIEDPEYAASAPPVEDYVNHAVQDLENHALDKSRETTSAIVNLVKVAEDTRGVAGSTLETLHDQGAQIQRTHEKAVHLDQHLERVNASQGPGFLFLHSPVGFELLSASYMYRDFSFARRCAQSESDTVVVQGEKLLNSLGGIFSKSWKPKKTRKITGPMISRGSYSLTLSGTLVLLDHLLILNLSNQCCCASLDVAANFLGISWIVEFKDSIFP